MSFITRSASSKRPHEKNSIKVGMYYTDDDDDREIYYVNDRSRGKRELTLPSKIDFTPFLKLSSNQRSASYISSPSGSGKSVLSAHLINELRQIRGPLISEEGIEERKVVIFSLGNSKNDDAYNSVKNVNLVHVDLNNPDFLNIEPDMLENCVAVFDDFTSAGTSLKKAIILLVNQLLELSRKQKTDVLVISHVIRAGIQSKTMIFESDSVYLNPASNINAVKKFLSSYADMEKKDIDELQNLFDKSDDEFAWLLLHKSHPRYIIYNNVIKMI